MKLLLRGRLPGFARQPVILAFMCRFRGFARAELGAVRYRLRGLGATLVVVEARRLSVFCSDGSAETEAAASAVDLSDIEALRLRYGMQARHPEPAALAIAVLDGSQRVRLRASSDELSESARSLCDALALAFERLMRPSAIPSASAFLPSRPELVTLGLVGAFAAVLSGGEARPSAAIRTPHRPAPLAVSVPRARLERRGHTRRDAGDGASGFVPMGSTPGALATRSSQEQRAG